MLYASNKNYILVNYIITDTLVIDFAVRFKRVLK